MRGLAGAQRWTGAVREGVDAVGQTPVLAAAGCGGAWGSADRGDVRVRCWLAAGCGLAGAFGRCGCGGRFWLARCGGRAVRDAGAAQGALAGFLTERKMLDKLCKSILNWKQGITQAVAGDGLRHRPHRRSCSVYPTSTSSVAAWPPRHLPRIAKGDARSHPRRALPPSGSPAGVRIPRPPHPSRRLRSCAARSTRAFPALPSAKRRRKTPPRIEPMLGGVL